MPRAQVEAAGAVLWRATPSGPEVAVVHRPRYDDWSLPKGKLTPGEHPLLGALREVTEETGCTARPGRRLGSLRYQVLEGSKRVRYWACEAGTGRFVPGHEVDQLEWLPLPAAEARLAPEHDRPVLARFSADPRRTEALLVVRHASAGDKRSWPGRDADRPLDESGRARAHTVAALLTAYGVQRAGAADTVRCRDTLVPFAEAAGIELEVLAATTAAEGLDPDRGADQVLRLFGDSGSAAWCGQREVIGALSAALCRRLGGDPADAARLPELRKGGLLVLHVDERRRLVAAERLPG